MAHKRPGSKFWYIEGPDGRPQSSRTTVKADAEALEGKGKKERWDQSVMGAAKKYSWNEAVVERVTRVKDGREVKSSWRDEERYLKWWHPFLEDAKDLNEITRDMIDSIIRRHRENISADPKFPTSENTTANKYVNAVSNILNRAERYWGWKGVRAPVLKLYPTPRHKKEMPTAALILAFCEELPDHSADITLFAAATAMRRGPILSMEWEWINWDKCSLHVPGWAMKLPYDLDIPLNETAMAVLHRRRAAAHVHIKYVFTYRGEKLGTVTTKHYHAAAVRAGLPKAVTLHWMRHWANSMLIRAKVEKPIRCRLGAWALPKDANEIYSHMTVEDLRPYSSELHKLFVAAGITSTELFTSRLKSHGLTIKAPRKAA